MGVYCIQPSLASIASCIRCQAGVIIYLHIRGAFGVARFGLTGQCEGLRIVERVTSWLHAFLFCISANKINPAVVARQSSKNLCH